MSWPFYHQMSLFISKNFFVFWNLTLIWKQPFQPFLITFLQGKYFFNINLSISWSKLVSCNQYIVEFRSCLSILIILILIAIFRSFIFNVSINMLVFRALILLDFYLFWYLFLISFSLFSFGLLGFLTFILFINHWFYSISLFFFI
jgi:hypothetical protein